MSAGTQDRRLRGRIGRALALLGMVETVRGLGMDAADIGLLVVLASHADDDGTAHPSQSTLAEEVGRERPWVNRHLAALAKTGIGEDTAVEKVRRKLSKGGETSCRYRIPLMDLSVVGAVADSPEDTPCSPQSHEQKQTHHQTPSSCGARAPRGREVCGAEEGRIAAGWTPSPEDVAYAAAERPDLSRADLLRIAGKLAARHGGRLPLADASIVFRRWILTERIEQDARRPVRRPSGSPVERAAPGAANRDKALAALTLLAGGDGRHRVPGAFP